MCGEATLGRTWANASHEWLRRILLMVPTSGVSEGRPSVLRRALALQGTPKSGPPGRRWQLGTRPAHALPHLHRVRHRSAPPGLPAGAPPPASTTGPTTGATLPRASGLEACLHAALPLSRRRPSTGMNTNASWKVFRGTTTAQTTLTAQHPPSCPTLSSTCNGLTASPKPLALMLGGRPIASCVAIVVDPLPTRTLPKRSPPFSRLLSSSFASLATSCPLRPPGRQPSVMRLPRAGPPPPAGTPTGRHPPSGRPGSIHARLSLPMPGPGVDRAWSFSDA